MGDGLREQIARDFAPSVWPTLLERHRDRLRLRADAVLALPAVQRLVEQAAEATRLRAAVEKLAESWRYKGEFGWGAWQEGQGPDLEGTVLDGCATDLRRALDGTDG